MKPPEPDFAADELLIRRALRGDHAAVHELVIRLMPVIRAKARAALRANRRAAEGRDLADDLSQDVWLHLVGDGGRRLTAFDPSHGVSLESYVAILAEREVTSQQRRREAKKRGGHLVAVEVGDLALTSPEPTPEERVSSAQLANGLQSHLEHELSERGQLVWRYTFADGRDPKETARLLGVEVQVIYNWQHKIRQLARAFLDHEKTPSPSA